jgi:hypothetical protein
MPRVEMNLMLEGTLGPELQVDVEAGWSSVMFSADLGPSLLSVVVDMIQSWVKTDRKRLLMLVSEKQRRRCGGKQRRLWKSRNRLRKQSDFERLLALRKQRVSHQKVNVPKK